MKRAKYNEQPIMCERIHPHELATLESLVANTPQNMAFCPPLQRALLERIVQALKGLRETTELAQPTEVEEACLLSSANPDQLT